MKRIYLDYAATTPLREEVLEAMMPYLTEKFGNPSSIHYHGREIRAAVDEARDKVAQALNAQSSEIYFTSGGTEADNIAIIGTAFTLADKGKHIITSAVEHHAALDACKSLEKHGFQVTVLPVDKFGRVSTADLETAITPETILVSLMHANNEVGTIQPIKELAAVARERGVRFHTDAVQTVGNIPVDVQDLGVDMLSLSAHKIYGPKGVGLLWVRKGTKLNSITFGGAQEKKLRPGTENVAGIIGLSRALELAVQEQPETKARLTELRDHLISGLTTLPDVWLNGHPQHRLPGNVNVSVDRVEGEALILSLDMAGIAVSSGSACTSGSLDPSHVLMSMGLSHQQAHGSLRLTLGKSTTREDIEHVLTVVPDVVKRLRDMSPIRESGEEQGEHKCTPRK
ncbi:MAG: cysteine desulfurase NifS [Firmicutes bacterium]|nr:cysteine desulfurase NifS [Bacillota bacterium]